MRPVQLVAQLCPHAKWSYIAAFEHGDGLFKQHGITTPLRLAHFLAQALHESGGLTIEYESGEYSAARLVQIFGVGHHSAAITDDEADQLAHKPMAIFERVYGLGNPKKAHELGNINPGDGYRYRGTGIMQTTGRANFRRMGEKCGVDFENHPELVLSAEHALKPALAEWTEGNLNDAADRDDIRAITKKINGGYNGLESRQTWFRTIRPRIDKVDLIDNAPPTPKLPPDVVLPAPKPPIAPVRHSAAAGSVIATILAAIQANKIETALLIVGIGLALVTAIYLWPKRKD